MKYLSALQAIQLISQLPEYSIQEDLFVYDWIVASLHSLVISLALITFFFLLIDEWLLLNTFARFNLHWALSNRLSYREEIGKKTFAEFFTTPL